MPDLEPQPLAAVLVDLSATFANLQADWYLLGALAAQVHGVVRSTADVDVTIRLGSTTPGDLISRLRGQGFEPLFDDEAFVQASRVIPVQHIRSGVMVDITLAGPGLEDLFFARRTQVEVAGVPVPVASAEDLLIMKMLAAREKDLGDCRAILRGAGATLDQAYVEEILQELETALGVSDLMPLWQRLLSSNG